MDLSTLYDMLEPWIIRTIQSNNITVSSTGDSTGGLEQHSIFGPYHTGQLDESQALWVDSKITNKIADHAAQADAHHFKVHNILSSDHTVTGGDALDLIGLSAAATLAKITPSSNPGATAAILRTDSGGAVSVANVITPLISTDTAVDMVLSPGGDLTLEPDGDVFVTGLLQVNGNANVTGDLDVDTTIYGNVSVITPLITNTSTLAITSTGGNITLDSSADMIHILSDNNLQTDNFASELLGWRMTYSGELDARYIYSEQMKVKLFIAEMEMAIAGSQMVLKSSTTTSRPFLVPYPGYFSRLYVNDLKGAEDMAGFETGDMVRLRTYSRSGGSLNTTDGWGKVSSYNNETGKEQRWNWLREGTCTINLPSQVGVAQTASSSSTTSLTLTKVSGTASGHQMYAFVTWTNTAAVVTPPSDWTLLSSDSITGLKVALYTKTAGGSEPADYTWTWDVSTGAAAHLSAWRNVLDPDLEIGITKQTTAATYYVPSDVFVISPACLIFTFTGATTNVNIDQPELWQEVTDVGTTNLRNQVSYTTSMDNGFQTGYSGDISSSTTSITITVHATPTYSGLSLTTGYMAPGQYIPEETTAMDYGIGGNGWHEITAVDGAYGSNSPYARVVTWATHPAVDPTVRAQMGHLKGLFGVDNEFGFYAGNGTTTADDYLRLSSDTAQFNNIPISMYDGGTERMRINTSYGIDMYMPSVYDEVAAISWRSALNTGTAGARIHAHDESDATGLYLESIASGAADNKAGYINLSAYDNDQTLISQIAMLAPNVGNSYVRISANEVDLGVSTSEVTIEGTKTIVNSYLGVTGPVSETALGVDNVRIGIVSGAPRIIFEDASATQWEIDNVSGALRFFVPGTVYGQFTTNGFQSTSNLFAGGVTFAGEDGIRLVTSAGFGYIDTKGSYGLIFRYDNTNGSTERMRIADGTVSITGNLAISGNCDPATLGGSWNNLSFISGWDNVGGWQTGQYKKVGDLVFLRGFVVRTSGSSAYIATLPSGYRPPAPDRWAVTTDAGAHGNIQIDSNGDIQVIVGDPTAYMTLSGIMFSVAS